MDGRRLRQGRGDAPGARGGRRGVEGAMDGGKRLLRVCEVLIGLFLAGAAFLYILCGENSHIAVHDNLDLFVAQYQMLREQGSFFSQGTASLFLGGISRDVLPSERSLTGLIYWLLPPFAAYITLYFVKIGISIAGFWLLTRELLTKGRSGEEAGSVSKPEEPFSDSAKAIALLGGFAYGILNVFPAYGICFASIPLYVWLMIRLYRVGSGENGHGKERMRSRVRGELPYLAGLFAYPFVSYFSYFGLFLLAYSVLGILWMWIRDRRLPLRLVAGTAAMAVGCVFFEYRLFRTMLGGGAVTIRETMVQNDFTPAQVLGEIGDVFVSNIFHADGVQKKLILPVCAFYFVFLNVRYVVRGQGKRIFHDLYNLIALLLGFNVAIYGLYDFRPFRTMVERLVPTLKGWQFNRTIFFSPFLWYAAMTLIALRLMSAAGRRKSRAAAAGAILLPMLSAALVLATPNTYNDLNATLRGAVKEKMQGQMTDDLSWREFYSPELFAKIREDLGYSSGNLDSTLGTPQQEAEEQFGDLERDMHTDNPLDGTADDPAAWTASARAVAEQGFQASGATGTDWAVAYGLHPAVLEYNGIATLDGYLGFYNQSYKDVFRAAIAPALDRRPASEVNFDAWGARCYLYSGDEDGIVQAVRHYQTISSQIAIDGTALRDMGCRYLFSRIRLTNAAEKHLYLRGEWSDETSPYTIYVYELK